MDLGKNSPKTKTIRVIMSVLSSKSATPESLIPDNHWFSMIEDRCSENITRAILFPISRIPINLEGFSKKLETI